MQNPIFNSIIKKIQVELQNRGITPIKFRIWKDSTIFATGLELGIEIVDATAGIKELNINLDWDKFREIRMARQLKGMDKHPLLQQPLPANSRVNPTIDVEVCWVFDEKAITNTLDEAATDGRLRYASSWMNALNEQLSLVLPTDKLISRWHLDVATDEKGKYVSAMNLITYYQYSLKNVDDINQIHTQISARLETILSRTKQVLQLAGKTRPMAA